ncbi:MAG: hypothetical protein EOP93_01975 [Lysobacteraceae bacterium]|nr:MAG: hypothetical protein EOP93_01975 [Xanthomonadaceae bacterium]
MPPSPHRVARQLPAFLLWAGMAACAVGLVVHRMWEVMPFPRFFEHVLLALLALLAAWPLQRWLHWTRAIALAAVWLLALVVFAGPAPMLAVAMLAAAAIALGSLVVAGPVALPLGLAIIAGALGWVLPLPIHHRATYALACIALIAWRRRAIGDACGVAWRQFQAAASSAPAAATAAILLLGLASTATWLPTVQSDDVTYHLGLPWQLQETARYAMDPTLQVWALAPWAGDVLQGVAQVLAGGEARGALDALWLCVTAVGMLALAAALGADAQRRWWAVALMASLPLSMHLAGGMQTELPAMALLPALAWLVLRDDDPPSPRILLAGAILFGVLCGLKIMHFVVALPVLAWAGWRHRARVPWRWLPLALLAVVASGGSSYGYAWAITGNPVLPLLNATFRSPYYPAMDFRDERWHHGLDGDLLWDISFDTEHYFESFDGGFGFVLVALAGVWLLALLDRRTRGLAAAAAGGMLLALLPMQYARYLQPSLVLLLPALVVAYPRVRADAIAFWSLCALNLAFASNASWILRTGALKRAMAHPGDDAPLLERYAPERLLVQRYLRGDRDQRAVLVLPGNFGGMAELGQRGRAMSWHAPLWQAQLAHVEADSSGEAWAHLLRNNRIGAVIVKEDQLGPARLNGLRRVGAAQVGQARSVGLWRLPEASSP